MKKIMKKIITIIIAMSLSSCTYNISMSHTSGGSTDTIDDNLTNTPSTDVSPTLNLPLKSI